MRGYYWRTANWGVEGSGIAPLQGIGSTLQGILPSLQQWCSPPSHVSTDVYRSPLLFSCARPHPVRAVAVNHHHPPPLPFHCTIQLSHHFDFVEHYGMEATRSLIILAHREKNFGKEKAHNKRSSTPL